MTSEPREVKGYRDQNFVIIKILNRKIISKKKKKIKEKGQRKNVILFSSIPVVNTELFSLNDILTAELEKSSPRRQL